MYDVAAWTMVVIGAGLTAATLLPLIPSRLWWIRDLDFPRMQIAAGCVLTSLLLLTIFRTSTPLSVAAGTAAAASALYQFSRIFPYLPIRRRGTVSGAPSTASVRILIANVLMDNRDAGSLLRLVEENDPDIVLLLEPDNWWAEQMTSLEADRPHTVKHPRSNTYGMLLYSRIALIDPQIRFLIQEDVPSITTGLELPNGERITFYGVHPRPPRPGKNSTDRDLELLLVGNMVAERNETAIVGGDLNDVAWSRTTRRFLEISGMTDPRIGRGLFNTFHASMPLLRWPLDHLFHADDLSLTELRRLPGFGSDHFPILIGLKLEAAQNASPRAAEELADD